MKKLLNELIQLQELYFAQEEHKVAGEEEQLNELELAIETLSKQLPAKTAGYFQQLQRRDPPAIAPVVNQTCYGCGINLPTSLSAELFRFDTLYQCPNCARFLYPYQGPKLTLHDPMLQHKLPRLGIEKFSSEKLMLARLQAEDGPGAISEIAHLISGQLFFPDPQILIDKALKREAIMPTAMDHALAFPHVRGVDAGCLTLALGLKPKGIKFGAAKNRLTKIFFFIVIPISASAFYLKLLAGLVETFQSAEARNTLLECEDPALLWKTLKKLTSKYIR